ncbi:MAG TPA: PilW family protein, partial [Arenimonas sp.]|nr:PilW family protein [Arenimonas sp.]
MSRRPHSAAARVRGLSLIELMVGMVIGLMLSGAAIGVFLSNKQVFTTTDNLGRMQDNGRFAFESLARDIREAGGNPCSRHLPIANTLNDPGNNWWSNWGEPVQGTEGAAGGSDSIIIKSGGDTGLSVTAHNASSAGFKVSSNNHGLKDGDILMICDYTQASIFQATNVNEKNREVGHNTGTATPGNCTKDLGLPLDCTPGGKTSGKTYGANSVITKLQAVRWYVAANGRGSNSLFRDTLGVTAASTAGTSAEEMIDGVVSLQLSYLVSGANVYVAASSVAADRWRDVIAVRADLTLESES